jgi:2-desacetyl-2-hydroxyethyl bacteriochlorophyllide A dehydrogenase
MFRQVLFFTGPAKVAVAAEPLSDPGPNQVLVNTLFSGISPGTEMLLYRNQFPDGMRLDETIPALSETFQYPLKYGYAAVGRVVETGWKVPKEWSGRLVFAFQPHASHFLADPQELLLIPPGVSPELATMLPNMETAVNFLLDGAPLLGEQVIVFGQGIVGLLLTALLAKMPLAGLLTLDLYPRRRLMSENLGAQASLDPTAAQVLEKVKALMADNRFYQGADLAYEVSGHPGALDQAIASTGYHGRVVIGSWYGRKKTELHLGGDFHRSRIRLISSQVSTIAPELTGRWTKSRILGLAWRLLREVQPLALITHTFKFSEAASAYALLDDHPEQAIQVVMTYG